MTAEQTLHEPPAHQADPVGADMRTGKPSGGGLGAALRGVNALRVPSLRSLLRSLAALVLLLASTGAAVTSLDRWLTDRLTAAAVPGRTLLAVVAALAGLAALALLPGFALDAPMQRQGPRLQRRRLVVTAALVVISVLAGALWARGLLAS